jgi:hypothetical protein
MNGDRWQVNGDRWQKLNTKAMRMFVQINCDGESLHDDRVSRSWAGNSCNLCTLLMLYGV